jgi:hypothetical protein
LGYEGDKGAENGVHHAGNDIVARDYLHNEKDEKQEGNDVLVAIQELLHKRLLK